MMRKAVFVFLFLDACAQIQDKPVEVYNLTLMQHLQMRKAWGFEGRLALSNEKDSISASISWRHNVEKDEIELMGPLAQGRVAITMTANTVVVDDGENPREYSGQTEDIVSQQLGVDMPVNALKYWVLGVNDPAQAFVLLEDGFIQKGWSVKFKEMQRIDSEILPKKINVEKDKTRIKLIVDRWDLS